MATPSLHPTAIQHGIVLRDDSDGTDVVLERTPVPIEQYLRTMYHPDRDYADGCAEERNVGEYEHGRVQQFFLLYFGAREKETGLRVVPECRLQVTEGRFRIPDVLVLRAGAPTRPYPTTAPLVCIEVLSPEDTVRRVRTRLEDYRRMGVENIWVLDPESRTAQVYTAEGYRNVNELTVIGASGLTIPVVDVFSLLEGE